MVEKLDKMFKETQEDLCLSDPDTSDSTITTSSDKRQPSDVSEQLLRVPRRHQAELIVNNIHLSLSLFQDWNNCSSIKSLTEDELYITASEGHHHSRSSSFHTVSECAHSPWWGESIERNSLDADSLDQEVPTMELLSGVVSSANVSFDDTEQTFHSPEPQSPETETIRPTLIMMPPPPLPRKSSHDSQADSNFESHEEDSKSASSIEILDRPESQSDSACSMDKLSPSITGSGDDAIEVRSGYERVKESGLSYYYQNIITTQSLKTCL